MKTKHSNGIENDPCSSGDSEHHILDPPSSSLQPKKSPPLPEASTITPFGCNTKIDDRLPPSQTKECERPDSESHFATFETLCLPSEPYPPFE